MSELQVEPLEATMTFKTFSSRGQFRVFTKDGRQPRWLVHARKLRRKRRMKLRKKRGW